MKDEFILTFTSILTVLSCFHLFISVTDGKTFPTLVSQFAASSMTWFQQVIFQRASVSLWWLWLTFFRQGAYKHFILLNTAEVSKMISACSRTECGWCYLEPHFSNEKQISTLFFPKYKTNDILAELLAQICQFFKKLLKWFCFYCVHIKLHINFLHFSPLSWTVWTELKTFSTQHKFSCP